MDIDTDIHTKNTLRLLEHRPIWSRCPEVRGIESQSLRNRGKKNGKKKGSQTVRFINKTLWPMKRPQEREAMVDVICI